MTRATTMLAIAALLAAGGAYGMRPQPLPPASYEDTGEPLFPDFEDPAVATSLEVIAWDEASAALQRFSVEQKDGRWIIPSHNDYPADGTVRMGKAAASFVGVKRDLYYGDNPADHAAFGVLDPEGADGKGEEKGQRIKIKDAAGTTLVDIIIGKAVEGKAGYHYVRFPDSKRVYASALELDISTEFADWIEDDLLRVERDDIVAVHYDPYQVDEAQGKVLGSNPLIAERGADDAETWVAAEGVKSPAGKVLDDGKIRQMITAIDNIKIVGVRPRPNPLTLPALQSKGFFVTPDGRRLFGNEGQASIVTEDGVVYTLYFGEVTFESGLALTAGKAESSTETNSEGEAEEAGGGGENANRYMFVDVRYDPALDRTQAKSADAEAEAGSESSDGDTSETSSGGAERAAKLRERFDAWFYVISDNSFKQIHKDRAELFKSKDD